MSNSPNARRLGGPKVWVDLARPDAEQSQRFLAEALALLLADLLRSVLSDASPALPADESAVERYRHLADSLADGETRRRTSLGITRAGLAKRCVTWLKLLLTPAPNASSSAAMREFVDAEYPRGRHGSHRGVRASRGVALARHGSRLRPTSATRRPPLTILDWPSVTPNRRSRTGV
jgi:hypothetical protein